MLLRKTASCSSSSRSAARRRLPGAHLATACLLLFAAAGEASPPTGLLQVSLTDRPPAGSTREYRSDPSDAVTRYAVMDGATLYFSRRTGRPYSLRLWATRLEHPADEQVIAVTPNMRDGNVQLQVSYLNNEGGELTQLETRVEGPLNTWLMLMDTSSPPDGRVLTSGRAEALFVRVSR